jgi:phage baseplate assembly protein W
MALLTKQITKLYKDLDLAFTLNPVTGDVGKKIDVNAVSQSLKILILTNFYERRFAPEKGANLRGMLFENMTRLQAEVMSKVIRNLIETYEPRAVIESIAVIPDYDKNLYQVSIYYFARGFTQPQEFNVNLQRLR